MATTAATNCPRNETVRLWNTASSGSSRPSRYGAVSAVITASTPGVADAAAVSNPVICPEATVAVTPHA